jgi:predicted nucleic acid-binding protein
MTDTILDTTFFIDLRRGNHRGARAMWQRIRAGEISASYSPVTVYELWVGQRFDRDEELFYEAVMQLLEEVPLTSAAARQAAVWLRGMRENLTESLIRDALIAATGHLRGEQECSANRRDFARLGLEVLPY